MRHRFPTRAMQIALVLLVATGVLCATPTLAIAATTSPLARVTAPASSAHPAVVKESPSSCTLRADNPHLSTHSNFTRMNGVVETNCWVPVPLIAMIAQMWKAEWYGWMKIGVVGHVSATWRDQLKTEANDPCKNIKVRVTGLGYEIDNDRDVYTATVESIHVNNPCGL